MPRLATLAKDGHRIRTAITEHQASIETHQADSKKLQADLDEQHRRWRAEMANISNRLRQTWQNDFVKTSVQEFKQRIEAYSGGYHNPWDLLTHEAERRLDRMRLSLDDAHFTHAVTTFTSMTKESPSVQSDRDTIRSIKAWMVRMVAKILLSDEDEPGTEDELDEQAEVDEQDEVDGQDEFQGQGGVNQ
jgi:hypothetical protein